MGVHGGRRLKSRREARALTMKERMKMQMPKVGAPFEHDRLWRVTGPGFCAGLTEYNDEISTYAPILKELFRPHVHYGGNAYYILNQARARGYTVEAVDRRRGNHSGEQPPPRMRLRKRRNRTDITGGR